MLAPEDGPHLIRIFNDLPVRRRYIFSENWGFKSCQRDNFCLNWNIFQKGSAGGRGMDIYRIIQHHLKFPADSTSYNFQINFGG